MNLLRSQYAPLFLAAWRTSAHILKGVKEQFAAIPELSACFWSPWTFTLSSAVRFLFNIMKFKV